ncbi:putative NAD(P)H-dependent D-xylose reductase xyl1 [Diplonema papillatum]|nr:putative NAD(P)H-dependent D-xylose reductase xyl1 [Diplonema papillatum]
MTVQKEFVLSTGSKMPAVGLGCWKIPNDVCEATTYEAIKAGYRLIDEACAYGNEKECGAGIKRAIGEGIVTREKLWVTSKLWNTYHRKEHVKAACKRTLSDLGLEYLDLYLIHFPIALKFVPFETRYPPDWAFDPKAEKVCMEEDSVPMHETWEAMEELVKEGLVRHIGLSNVGTTMLRDVLNYAKVKPTVLQIELHPYLTQSKLIRLCREKQVAVTGFSSFGASSYVELGAATEVESCLVDPVVKSIADKHKKTPAQVALRWAVQRGTAVIPKSTKVSRLKENIDLFDFELTDEEMKTLDGLNKNRRFNDPGTFCEPGFGTFFPIFE